MKFYIILLQAILIILKVAGIVSLSWWVILIPFNSFIASNIVMFIYTFCIAFKREYLKKKMLKKFWSD